MSTRDEIEYQDQARLARLDALDDQEARDSTRGREAEDASKPTEKSLELARDRSLAALIDTVRQEQHEATCNTVLSREAKRLAESEQLVEKDDYYKGYQDALYDWHGDTKRIAVAPPPTKGTE